jgi:hypothetical protein
MFVASVFSRLSASGSEQLSVLFSAVPPSPAVHKFKVSMCPKFLVDTANDGHSRVEERPRVQARAQPRALARDTTTPGDTSTSESSGPLSHYSKLPEYNEIRRLTETEISTSSINFMTLPLLMRIKFELFNSYAALQSEIPRSEKDPEWVNCLQDESLNRTLDRAFGGESGRMYKESLQSIVRTYVAIP